MPTCLNCQQLFTDYKGLAHHIIANKKTHKRGLLWASKYIMRQRQLDRKATEQGRNYTPLTQTDKDNRHDLERVLSGVAINSPTICPKCKHKSISQFPIEYAESRQAWRVGNALVKLCVACGGN